MREIRKIIISVYKKDADDEYPKIIEDIKLSPAPESILKAKATHALRKHSNSKMEPWQKSREYFPENYRNAGTYQVRIHKFE